MELNRSKLIDSKNMKLFINEMKEIFFHYVFDNEKLITEKAKELFLTNIDNDEEKMNLFFKRMEEVQDQYIEDLKFFKESDPAADCYEEIISVYPGYIAIRFYRLAHELYKLGYKTQARFIAERAHNKTGVDIHPGATISCPFFIDHGTGIVIGETTVIGERCKIYQGVTLGAKSLSKGHLLKDVKRHPTIGNNVTIYANASILGGDTVIGDNTIIGSSVFIVGKNIPANHKVILNEPCLTLIEKTK